MSRRTVLHIGVPKTATTTIQSCLAAVRPRLTELGVLYPGKGVNQVPAVRTPLDWPTDEVLAEADRTRWESLQRAVRRFDGTVVVSAEHISTGSEAQARRIVEGLGGDVVEAVVTLRCLAPVLPSAWQEDVKAGITKGFAHWLDEACPPGLSPDAMGHSVFWVAHDHASIVRRWASIVGVDKLTVVVVDPFSPNAVFEHMDEAIGLPVGTLDPTVAERGNRSMTYGETELVRLLNGRVGTDDPLAIRRRPVPARAVWNMTENRRPGPEEPKAVTPRWACERIVPVADNVIETVSGLGCRVLGDLEALRVRPGDVSADLPADPVIPVQAAALLTEWILTHPASRALIAD